MDSWIFKVKDLRAKVSPPLKKNSPTPFLHERKKSFPSYFGPFKWVHRNEANKSVKDKTKKTVKRKSKNGA